MMEAVKSKAVARYVRISPRKARLVIDLIRGKSVDEALAILRFTPVPPHRSSKRCSGRRLPMQNTTTT